MSLAYTELKQVVPEIRQVFLDGQPYTIKRFGLRKLKDVAVHAAYIAQLVAITEAEKQAAKESGVESSTSAFELLVKGGDAAFELMAMAIDKPVEFFDDVDPVEGADLFIAVLEVNVDFFVNTLSQRLPEMTQRLTGLMQKAVASKNAPQA